MICLNYHRVDSSGTPDFYTLPPDRLMRHLEEIQTHGLRVVGVDELLSATRDDGMVMLTFDDGTEDHATQVFPILESTGARGVFFVSTAKVGLPGYLTRDQIRKISSAGHDIECHGHSHRRMDTMPGGTLKDELGTSVELIRDWTGRPPRILAPPGGFVSKQVVAAGRKHGLETIRTMNWNTNQIPLGQTLDCLVIAHGTSDERFRQWLQGKGMLRLRSAYLAKQVVRGLVPSGLYLKLRGLLRPR